MHLVTLLRSVWAVLRQRIAPQCRIELATTSVLRYRCECEAAVRTAMGYGPSRYTAVARAP
eukprot:2330275-Alexandrium_andersonii.AAC.1